MAAVGDIPVGGALEEGEAGAVVGGTGGGRWGFGVGDFLV